MSYEVKLSPDEKIIKQIDQNIAGRGFLFWRKFKIVLTNKRLHGYQKFILSYNQKTFDLKDIDSIFQEKYFNGGWSFISGFFIFIFFLILGIIFQSIAFGLDKFSPFIVILFATIGLIAGTLVFILYFFKHQLIVSSKNDKMLIDLIRIPQKDLSPFVDAVLKQKELLNTYSNTPNQSINYTEKLHQLRELMNQGLITEHEYEQKKKEILNLM